MCLHLGTTKPCMREPMVLQSSSPVTILLNIISAIKIKIILFIIIMMHVFCHRKNETQTEIIQTRALLPYDEIREAREKKMDFGESFHVCGFFPKIHNKTIFLHIICYYYYDEYVGINLHFVGLLHSIIIIIIIIIIMVMIY